MRFPKAFGAGLLSVGLLVSGLALSSAPAQGFLLHPYLSQITEAKGAPFGQPWGLAFDPAGNLLVADARGKAIDVFDSSDTFTGQLSSEVFSGSYIRGVAVSDATGDVYVADSGPETIDVFKPEGGGTYKLLQSRRFGGGYVYVAVDNSSGPHGGDVYVLTASAVYVVKPNAAGELVEAGTELAAPEEGFSLLGSGGRAGLAIDGASGTVYVANPGHQTVDEYSSGDVYTHIKLTGPSGPFEPVGVAVEESTGDVYVVDDSAHDVVDEFDAAGRYIGRTVAAGNAEPLAVAVDASGRVFVSEGGAVSVFGAPVDVQYVSTGPSNAVVRTSAKLQGVVNPEGEAITTCRFEYGTTTAYGQTAACTPAPGSGSSPVTVSAEVSGLVAGSSYHYRLVAGGVKGLDPGEDLSFTATSDVAPELRTEAPEVKEPTTGAIEATLNGSLAPDGSDTHYYFEYGETEAYGSVSPVLPGADAGEAFQLEHVQRQISGLKGSTQYHFRIVASNSLGTEDGADVTFTTPSVVPELQTEAATGVEQRGLGAGVDVATLHASFAPDGADTHYYFEYGETEAYGSVSPALPGTDAGEAFQLEHVQTQIGGLKGATGYHFRIVAINSFGTEHGADMSFATPAEVFAAPVIGSVPATGISQFAATLQGTLQTDDALVNYHFEYGTSTAYGQVAPIPDAYTPVTSATVPVSQLVNGLQAGTVYHYRLVASSPGGTEVAGPDETFTTTAIPAPAVITGGVSGVGVGAATLGGTVDPQGWDTRYYFQYGTSTAYGSSWPTVQVDMGALEGPQPVLVGLSNLLPSTTYHYRLVATNGGGSTYGPDMTFTTGEYPAAIVQEPPALRTLLVPTEQTITTTPKQTKKKTRTKHKKPKNHKQRTGKKHKQHGRSKHKG